MIFFDEKNPNKYAALKKRLVPYNLSYLDQTVKKKRFGSGDGGYVLGDFRMDNLSILSYGVGNDPLGLGFEQSFEDAEIHCYDGSCDGLPTEIDGVTFVQENLNPTNFKNHVKRLNKNTNKILKMDIEGCEYDWLTNENLEICFENFDQIAIEVHGLIEEVPEGWIIEKQAMEAKKDTDKKKRFFNKLNDRFYLFHIHGNNHAPRYVDFPDSLELTYINKKLVRREGVNKTRCPDLSVDEPNWDGREDFVLDFWI